MNTFKKCILGFVFLGLLSMFMTGCNTVEGIGEDVESGGEKIQEVAD